VLCARRWLLADIRLYTRLLSAANVLAGYRDGWWGSHLDALAAHYPMAIRPDQANPSLMVDATGEPTCTRAGGGGWQQLEGCRSRLYM